MSRQEALQQEYQARVGRTRLDSALPPAGPRHRRYGKVVLLALLVLVLAGLACWFYYGAG